MNSFSRSLGIFFLAAGLQTAGATETNIPSKVESGIAELADRHGDETFELRTRLHQTPELPNREFRTAKLIEKFLKELKFDEIRTQVAHTGVIGVLKGNGPGPVIALRAAIDAQLDEKSETQADGTVTIPNTPTHSVGHDVNTALLLGTARVLAGMRDQIPGTVEFIFQPAGETSRLPAGEKGGARLMVEENALDNPRPDAIIALHTAPAPGGTVLFKTGVQFAKQFRMVINIKGRQTTGGMPWLGNDPVPVAAAIITALQNIPSRQLDITRSATVISIGKIQAGSLYSGIADKVTMEGTLRLTDESIEQDVVQRIRRTVEKTAESAGLAGSLSVAEITPMLSNDAQLTERLAPLLKHNPWISHLATSPLITGSEDFSFFTREVPGFYFLLGTGSDKEPAIVSSESLTQGVKILSSLVFDYLSLNNPGTRETGLPETGSR